ncbi:NADH-ubiquinone oxidoreductase complex I, 21 kDa subunit-domain-containing protein [Catenaria anguillulae PL171]|uniref:NADH-ubiquinone oxidoreductase complex I, 21 kDa subunit-domain-containing protein n=1 Tax=Catenaria anguillulae PL171 TaxID=765915 RepID=A0A1Y2HQK1_9FUNG|nr:NADH-ubiquinone oxidoreductase complex I, 21 kDa subunit-domain-containing protein [Catenaria anguillulae PL171]
MPYRNIDGEFPIIDTDPHASRVVRFFRPSDLGVWAALTAAGPAGYYWAEMKKPAGDFKIGVRSMGAVGFIGGFLLAYQRSSFRFWGLSENSREIEKDRAEFVAARAEGKPHHLGESDLEPYLQGVAARHSRYTALKFSWLPWFNFVHHNQCVNWDLYKDLVAKEQSA